MRWYNLFSRSKGKVIVNLERFFPLTVLISFHNLLPRSRCKKFLYPSMLWTWTCTRKYVLASGNVWIWSEHIVYNSICGIKREGQTEEWSGLKTTKQRKKFRYIIAFHTHSKENIFWPMQKKCSCSRANSTKLKSLSYLKFKYAVARWPVATWIPL